MSQYDLLIRGGTVIDPASGFRGVRDVAISGGRIVAAEGGEARRTIDAAGLYVVPGLIDLHTHLGFELHRKVVYAEDVCPPAGVTTAVDMGSTGAFTFPWYKQRILASCPVRLYEFINIASIGTIAIHTPYYVDTYGEYVDVADTRRMIEEHRDAIKGIKVFATSAMVGEWALHALRAAREVADAVQVPIAVHVSVQPPLLEEVLELLRPGDIITHTFTPLDQGILDAQGCLRPAVRAARERGVLFDLGHGAGSFTFEVARKALAQGFAPDTISSDIYYANTVAPVVDLLTTASKFLNLDMSLEDTLARVTSRPAQALGERDLGTLRPGAMADIALLALREGSFAYVDSRKQTLQGRYKLECQMTIQGGRIAYEEFPMSGGSPDQGSGVRDQGNVPSPAAKASGSRRSLGEL